MRLLVDAMCAEYGGIRTYVDHLLGHWGDVFPDDELHVALRVGSTLTTGNGCGTSWRCAGRTCRPPAGPDARAAPAGPLPRRGRRARDRTHHDRAPGGRAAVRRHPRPAPRAAARAVQPRPASPARRVLRPLVRHGGRVHRDLAAHPRRPAPAAPGDRESRPWCTSAATTCWPGRPLAVGTPVAFAHHTNKNPDLLFEAWALLAADPAAPRRSSCSASAPPAARPSPRGSPRSGSATGSSWRRSSRTRSSSRLRGRRPGRLPLGLRGFRAAGGRGDAARQAGGPRSRAGHQRGRGRPRRGGRRLDARGAGGRRTPGARHDRRRARGRAGVGRDVHLGADDPADP